MIRASGGLSCQDIGAATQHSAPLEPASLFRSHATNIRLRWSRPRYFAHTLQTFGSTGAGLVISLVRYKHSAPLEPASLFRSHATNIRLRREIVMRLFGGTCVLFLEPGIAKAGVGTAVCRDLNLDPVACRRAHQCLALQLDDVPVLLDGSGFPIDRVVPAKVA